VRAQKTREGRLRALSAFSNQTCAAVASLPPAQRDKVLRGVATRFAEVVPIDESDLRALIGQSIDEITEFAQLIRINLGQTQIGKQLRSYDRAGDAQHGTAAEGTRGNLADTILEPDLAGAFDGAMRSSGAGKAADAPALLAAGIQEISNTLVEEYALNDILRIILETIYRAMGFRRVLLCVKDGANHCMQGRFGFGPDAAEIARRFRFSLSFAPDIFHAALSNGVDILIRDIDDPKIASRVPDWFRNTVAAKTFVIFPLVIKKSAVALIYADQEKAGDIVITDKELSLLRTLRNQAVLAIKQAS